MHRVGWFFHEEREAYWEDAADRAPAIPLPDIDRDEQEVAMKAAQVALRVWYTHGHNHANTIIPQMQIDSKWKEVAAIPGWQAQNRSEKRICHADDFGPWETQADDSGAGY